MQAKIKPGDTFTTTVNGTEYKIVVMSVHDKLTLEDDLEKARESGRASSFYKAWLNAIRKYVVSWDRKEPIEDIAKLMDEHELADVFGAVSLGNVPSEDDLKN